MIKKIKKYCLIGSIVFVGLTVGMLIAGIFGLKIFKNPYLCATLLTFALICADCFFNNTALEVIDKTKVLALIAIGLLNLASIFGLILFWAYPGFDNVPAFFGKFSAILAITACFFTMIVSTNAKLGSHYKALKIIYFALIILVDIVLYLAILVEDFKLFEYDWFSSFFFATCFAIFALMCVTTILGRKVRNDIEETFVKLKKNEYDELMAKLNALEEENKSLKEELNQLKTIE